MALTLKGRLECPNKHSCLNAGRCPIAGYTSLSKEISSFQPELSFYRAGAVCNSYLPIYASIIKDISMLLEISPRSPLKFLEEKNPKPKYSIDKVLSRRVPSTINFQRFPLISSLEELSKKYIEKIDSSSNL